jgi:hypothetical protein
LGAGTDGERRAGERHISSSRTDARQDRADVDWGGGQGDLGPAAAGGRFNPIDILGRLLLDPVGDVAGQSQQPVLGGYEIELLRFVFDLAGGPLISLARRVRAGLSRFSTESGA